MTVVCNECRRIRVRVRFMVRVRVRSKLKWRWIVTSAGDIGL